MPLLAACSKRRSAAQPLGLMRVNEALLKADVVGTGT
ncbi:hypothetical protein SAMN05421510_10957 [Nitrosomonas ureae]|uniref:Uncharacterized protein n=1 Tax=Nitrosomonas ureae TaxID=44577 RepID=A0A1H9H9S8_9PROT|nr:hypothetical protein C8R27_1622 [Nitrosomonas ureae]SDU33403.1 hypothetical protein SAMN05216406_1573 [Nitrosomonas ureae]SEQ59080.1 hypothetical protein SAMN05421510_10957 [Nitrosomonas ureae]